MKAHRIYHKRTMQILSMEVKKLINPIINTVTLVKHKNCLWTKVCYLIHLI